MITALDKNRETQPIRNAANARNISPEPSVTAATTAGASSDGTPEVMTAAAATAASAELGPVLICRDEPNSA